MLSLKIRFCFLKILKETVDLQTGTGKHVPRAVFIDLEPSVIDETRQIVRLTEI